MILLITLFGCDQKQNQKKVHSIQFWGLGTQLSVQYYGIKNIDIEEQLVKLVRNLEGEISYYKKGSSIYRLNRAKPDQQIAISDHLCKLLRQAKGFTPLTGGKFDITYKSSGILWRDGGVIPSDLEIERHLKNINIELIELNCKQNRVALKRQGVVVDLGGIAKGYIIDRSGEHLKKSGINHFIINYGGDLLVCGTKGGQQWQVGIKDPGKPGEYLNVLGVGEAGECVGVATSGDYERFITIDGKKYSHIINPKTGIPVKNAHSITVIGESALLTDTLATAISVGVNDEAFIQRMVERFDLTVYLLRSGEQKPALYRKKDE